MGLQRNSGEGIPYKLENFFLPKLPSNITAFYFNQIGARNPLVVVVVVVV